MSMTMLVFRNRDRPEIDLLEAKPDRPGQQGVAQFMYGYANHSSKQKNRPERAGLARIGHAQAPPVIAFHPDPATHHGSAPDRRRDPPEWRFARAVPEVEVRASA